MVIERIIFPFYSATFPFASFPSDSRFNYLDAVVLSLGMVEWSILHVDLFYLSVLFSF